MNLGDLDDAFHNLIDNRYEVMIIDKRILKKNKRFLQEYIFPEHYKNSHKKR